jgi:hypothetical protein
MYFYIKFNYTDSKSFFFSKIKKPFSKKPKGKKCLGSPDRTILKLFV